MTNSILQAQEQMRSELRSAVHVYRYSNPVQGEPRSVKGYWRRLAMLGLRVHENLFRQWLSNGPRLPPMVSYGETAQALILAGIAEADEGRAIVDPAKWRSLVQKAATCSNYDLPEDTGELKAWLYQNSSRATQLKARQRAQENDGPRAFDPALAEKAMAEAHNAPSQADRGRLSHVTQMLRLPRPEDARAWLPLADAPSTIYWFWRWGVTKDQVRIALRVAKQWATDYKHGVADLSDPAATKWAWTRLINGVHTWREAYAALREAYGLPLPVKAERRLREGLIKLISQSLNYEWRSTEFPQFDQAMAFVKAKSQALIDRNADLNITVRQLHLWFHLALGANNEND